MEIEYTIKTKSRLLMEFSQAPEGMAKIILLMSVPFWGISWLVRKALHGETIKIEGE